MTATSLTNIEAGYREARSRDSACKLDRPVPPPVPLAVDLYLFYNVFMTDLLKGSLEATLLAAVASRGDGASGLDVRQAVIDRTGRAYAVGAIYTVLQRLEAKGWVTARLADARPVRGGRARRLFTVTADGHRALESFRQRAAAAWALPIPLVEDLC